jgi:Methylase involved in ubiquinone/menaquinone biosynthesis
VFSGASASASARAQPVARRAITRPLSQNEIMSDAPERLPDPADPVPGLAEIAGRFDARAADYDGSAMHRGLAAAVARFVDLDGVRSVLDVATGTGLVLRSLPIDDAPRLVGIDVSDGMLTVARRALPEAQFVQGDAQALPFEAGTFDLVTCVTALHLLADPIAALLEWRRVLSAGGRVVVAVFRTDGDFAGPAPSAHGPATDRHAAFGTRTALGDFAASAGMRVSRHTTWTHPEPVDECLIAEFVVAVPGRGRPRDA